MSTEDKTDLIIFMALCCVISASLWLLAFGYASAPSDVDMVEGEIQEEVENVDIEIQEVNDFDFDPCGLDTVVCPHEEESYGTGDVQDLIIKLSLEYGVDTDTALRIAKCESGFDPNAKNPNSTATGIYQWLSTTWQNIGSPGDRLNAEDNIRAFMVWYPKHPGWWVCK